ncbi:MAG: efflux RND transporter periplasmic adaptor subunit [Salinisphaera sp.]|jgi:membrane fusion protein (multidrug efflux system)|nr:efflux RND transporter periplasmic adaptor subunit [Salinisphaera sp.]
MSKRFDRKPSTSKRMIWMIVGVLLLVAAIVGVKVLVVMRTIANLPKPVPATVSTTVAGYQSWQPTLGAIGTLRAVRGADLALDLGGVVDEVLLRSGEQVKQGQILLQLRDGDDVAQLQQLEAAAQLARLNFRRAEQQRGSHAISTADFQSAASDMQAKQAAVARQNVLVAKKQLRAPFAGRAGIITVNPGDYLSAGTTIVTLQQTASLYADFDVPQRQLGRVKIGQTVHLTVDAYPGRRFVGKVTAINAKVDAATRNVTVEATVPNSNGKLVPGMFAHVGVDLGDKKRYLTLPQAAVVYNPYGDTVYVVQKPQTENAPKDDKGRGERASPTVQQKLITTGDTRGDQVVVLKGLQPGTVVVTSGQIKLKNGAAIKIDNSVQPADSPNPTPQEH